MTNISRAWINKWAPTGTKAMVQFSCGVSGRSEKHLWI